MSFDNYHQKKDRIYRAVPSTTVQLIRYFYGKGVPAPLPAALKTKIRMQTKVAVLCLEGNDQVQVLDDNGQPATRGCRGLPIASSSRPAAAPAQWGISSSASRAPVWRERGGGGAPSIKWLR